jgi:branched-chain amino acid transport system ATP-binding protein
MLKIDSVSTFYGKIEALKGIDIYIKENETVAIIGNNGAGKTTLINTITGMVKPKAGSIFFQDFDITGKSPEFIVKKGIIQVPEGREIFNDLTVRENLELGAYTRFKAEDKDIIEKDMEDIFTLFPFLKKRQNQIAGTLSGGEQQMLAIGRGLMSKPQLMLLDEPSLGLAPLIVKEVFSVVKELKKQGTTFLIVEQNAVSALQNSDRAYILELGKIAMEGDSNSLLNNEKVQECFLGKSVKKGANNV